MYLKTKQETHTEYWWGNLLESTTFKYKVKHKTGVNMGGFWCKKVNYDSIDMLGWWVK